MRKPEKTERLLRTSKDYQGNGNKRWSSGLAKRKRRGDGKEDNNSSGANIKQGFFAPPKTVKAAALKYDPDIDYAPRITALGKGAVAENIIWTAMETKVPVYRDESLVNTLNKLRIGDGIPRELFEIVAEVLVFISRSDERYSSVKERSLT